MEHSDLIREVTWSMLLSTEWHTVLSQNRQINNQTKLFVFTNHYKLQINKNNNCILYWSDNWVVNITIQLMKQKQQDDNAHITHTHFYFNTSARTYLYTVDDQLSHSVLYKSHQHIIHNIMNITLWTHTIWWTRHNPKHQRPTL